MQEPDGLEEVEIAKPEEIFELDFRSVEDFEQGESLGTGSMCDDVIRCTDRISGGQFAMKVVPKRAKSLDLDKASIMEAHCLRRLERSNFVVSLFWDLDTPREWIGVLELCQDGDLWRRVQSCGCVSPDESAWYASQMVEALAAVHSAGIVHRDVKCENFLLSKEKRLKLIDFGTARDTYHPEVEPFELDVSGAGDAVTPKFVSPEAARGEGHDRRSDLWSLGCAIFQLVTGACPVAASPGLITRKALDCALWLPSAGVQEAERDLILQLTKTDPNTRLGCQHGQTRRVLSHPLLRRAVATGPEETPLTALLRHLGRAIVGEAAAVSPEAALEARGELLRLMEPGEDTDGECRVLRDLVRAVADAAPPPGAFGSRLARRAAAAVPMEEATPQVSAFVRSLLGRFVEMGRYQRGEAGFDVEDEPEDAFEAFPRQSSESTRGESMEVADEANGVGQSKFACGHRASRRPSTERAVYDERLRKPSQATPEAEADAEAASTATQAAGFSSPPCKAGGDVVLLVEESDATAEEEFDAGTSPPGRGATPAAERRQEAKAAFEERAPTCRAGRGRRRSRCCFPLMLRRSNAL